MNEIATRFVFSSMNATSIQSVSVVPVRWRVVGFRVSVYQACHGAPVQPGGCCENCGQGIKYVVTVESNDGRRMDVGQDCAVTLHGGPELAEIRAAERAYEHELYLQSDEYRADCARLADKEAARAARAASAEQDHALALFGLRAILESPYASDYIKDYARTTMGHILSGDVFPEHDGIAPFSGEEGKRLSDAVVSAWLPAPKHLDAAEGARVRDMACTYVRGFSFNGTYGTTHIETFVTDDGSVIVWKGAGFYFKNEHGTYNGNAKPGDRVRVTATVKSHGDYNGMPQTYISRAKVVRA